MRPLTRLLPAALLSLALLGCGPSTEPETEAPLENAPGGSAAIHNSCAPDDGPALEFAFADRGRHCDDAEPAPDAPRLELDIYSAETSWETGLPAGHHTFAAGTEAWGRYWPEGTDGEAQDADTIEVHIESWGDDGAVLGWYRLTFADGSQVGASFEATDCGGEPMCG